VYDSTLDSLGYALSSADRPAVILSKSRVLEVGMKGDSYLAFTVDTSPGFFTILFLPFALPYAMNL